MDCRSALPSFLLCYFGCCRVEFWRGIALQPFLPSFFDILVVVVLNFGEGLPFSPSFLPSLIY